MSGTVTGGMLADKPVKPLSLKEIRALCTHYYGYNCTMFEPGHEDYIPAEIVEFPGSADIEFKYCPLCGKKLK